MRPLATPVTAGKEGRFVVLESGSASLRRPDCGGRWTACARGEVTYVRRWTEGCAVGWTADVSQSDRVGAEGLSRGELDADVIE